MTQTKNNLPVYGAMLLATVFWGVSFIWTNKVLAFYNPITVILLRLILSTLFLFPIGFALKQIQKWERKDIKNLIYLSFFQPFLYFIGENYSLVYVTPTVTSVLVATIPLFTPIAAYVFFRERISLMNFLGIFITIVGVILVMLKKDLSLKADLTGVLLVLLAVFSAIAYSVIIIRISDKYNTYSIIAYQNIVGVVMFLPLFFIFEWQNFVQVSFSWDFAWPLLQLSVFASSFAFMFFTYGIKRLGITKANTLANAIPVFTAIFSFYILGEQFNYLNIIGMLIVMGGLLLSQLKYAQLPHKTVRKIFHYLIIRVNSTNNKN